VYLWIAPHPTVFATQVWIHGMYVYVLFNCWWCWMTSVYSIQTQWERRAFVPQRFIIPAWGRVLNKPLVVQLVKKSRILWNMKCTAIFARSCRLFISWARSERRSCAGDAFPSFQLRLFWDVRATCLVNFTVLWSAKYLASKTSREAWRSEFCPASCYFLLFQMFIFPNITSW
jgi:hypothetical protein